MAQPVEFAAGLLHHCAGQRGVEFGVGRIGDEAENRHDDRHFREKWVNGQRRGVLIAGPTASGKSALALARAWQGHGVIVNADAMQVYDTLRIVTARPSAEDEALAEHRLYGEVPAGHRFSTGGYLAMVNAVLGSVDPDREVIFVGGTGLYFDALTKGFADVPAVPEAVTLEVQQEIQVLDEAGRMALLQAEDPETAERLKVADPQRVIRALAVKRATGRKLSQFQGDPQPALLDNWDIERIVLAPDREVLRARIARRFEAMFENGAVEEVEALLAQKLDPALPAMKAIGVPEIAGWLAGSCSREEAIALATIATHQYAKRQRTWFRNRMGDWPRLGLEGRALPTT
ncbi:MAG: tRNA (adenosine(37)-N6)-dimethylallyltransferase MiaA [Devosia sp.]|nr:tRNA (adenosine(37)-N6)-dimethylallyltransferase MiaA [Devosia sp.]